MREILIVIDVLSAIGIIGLVLLQQGKGADMGAAFGSGASQSLFGARGSANFLTRTTAILATIFFATNLGLAVLSAKQTQAPAVTQSVVQEVEQAGTETPVAPAVPAAPKAPEVPK